MSDKLKKALADARAALKEAKSKRLQAGLQTTNKAKGLGGGKNKVMGEETKKHLRKWGVKSFDELIQLNTSDRKFAYISTEDRERVKALKESVDVAVLCAQIFDKPVKETKFFREELQFQLKTFGIDSGDDGYEWIPTMVADSYIDEFNLERKVAGLFMEVKMPSNPYKWPVLTGGAIARKVGEVTALTTPQVFKTDKTIMFDAIKMTNQYALPEELSEDSAPDVIKVIRQELMEGQEKAMEIAILEGDADGTHQHYYSQLPDVAALTTTATASDSPEHFFHGIRKRLMAAAAAKVDAGGNSLTEAELSSARAAMGKFGVDPSQLAIIVGPKVYNQMLQLDDVRTLEQYGAQATVLSGELAKYEGTPVIVSEYIREDLHTTGFNTNGGDNDTGSVIIVNRKRWFVGVRRAIVVKVENNRTQYDVLDLVSFSRKAFQAVLKTDGSNYAQESSGAVIFNVGL
jgi:HK97 family phage major capsid protein